MGNAAYSRCCASTRPATPSSASANIRVNVVIWVSLWAVSLPFQPMFPPCKVHLASHCLQMIGLYAAPVTAKVIDLQAIRKNSHEVLEGPSMRVGFRLSLWCKSGISLWVYIPTPLPTVICLRHLR